MKFHSKNIEQMRLEEILTGPGHPSAFHAVMTPARPGARAPNFLEMREKLLLQHSQAPRDVSPLVIVSLAKSGSSLVSSILKSALHLVGTGFSWGYYDVVPGWAQWVSQGGVVTHDHLWPSALALDAMFDNGLNRIFVHYRDPRAVAVSRAHHFQRFNDSFIFECYVALALPWIAGWLVLADQYPDRIYTSSYESLLADPSSYFDNLLTWFSVKHQHIETVRAHIDIQLSNKTGNNFRQGTVDGWRSEISSELRERLWAYTPEPLARRLGMKM